MQVLLFMNTHLEHHTCKDQGPVVRKMDNATHWINLYPVDNTIDFLTLIHPTFEQPETEDKSELEMWVQSGLHKT